jgi:hypothetical protein
MVTHRFVTASSLDPEKVNDNLEAIARDVNNNLKKRYTYSGSVSVPLAGVTDASAPALRRLLLRRPGTNNAVEAFAVSVTLYTNAAVTATLTCSDVTQPPIVFTTSATTTTEVTAGSSVSVPIPNAVTSVVWTLSFSAAVTITSGEIRAYLRCDRGNQGTSHAGYTPNLIDASSSTAGSLLDTELTSAATAVTNDTTNDKDLRCEVFSVQNLASGSAKVIRLQSGARRKFFATGLVVAAATETATFEVDATSWAVPGIGASTTASGDPVVQISGTLADDPMDSADDTVLTITASGGGTVLLAQLYVWWS